MAAETKEELAKFTIPQLKERLKQRRLQISGTKNELINRLYESLQEEELLGEGASAPQLETEEDLLGNNETNGEQLTKNDEDLLLGIDENKKQKEEVTVSEESKEKVSEDGDKPPSNPEVKKRPSISAPEGVPKKVTLTTEDAKAKRAARFGLTATPVAKADTPSDKDKNGNNTTEKKPEIKTTDPKLLARAKRFGLPIGAADSCPAKVAKGNVEEDEKMKARRLRFGL
ncbi:unnamed protein product [Bursaphelenchus okinawaensis]|uniref:SAP domain-containing protein n=1 Tax=Bursaphelenchus okinawaensis TaxID=465554 RepID=A0A811KJN2_9BILA|nr:unnamed protein product [Bursaphelenchus okinawaensis]CAG9104684.1 unnamed protein product [Bursaphelenchus okinawaensis]